MNSNNGKSSGLELESVLNRKCSWI